jgi:hypothetical protein
MRTLVVVGTAVVIALPAHAGPGRDDSRSVEHSVQPWMHVGDQIRRSSVDGHQFSYHLLALEEKAVAGTGTPGISTTWPDPDHKKSHHLMLFLMDPDGKMMTDTDVGFAVKGPDGIVQEPRITLMTGGFGVDVDLNVKGTYEITTRIVAGNQGLSTSSSTSSGNRQNGSVRGVKSRGRMWISRQ